MTLENNTVLDNLISQRDELAKQLEGNREMYLKIVGAIEVLQQIEETNNPSSETEVSPTEVVEEG